MTKGDRQMQFYESLSKEIDKGELESVIKRIKQKQSSAKDRQWLIESYTQYTISLTMQSRIARYGRFVIEDLIEESIIELIKAIDQYIEYDSIFLKKNLIDHIRSRITYTLKRNFIKYEIIHIPYYQTRGGFPLLKLQFNDINMYDVSVIDQDRLYAEYSDIEDVIIENDEEERLLLMRQSGMSYLQIAKQIKTGEKYVIQTIHNIEDRCRRIIAS